MSDTTKFHTVRNVCVEGKFADAALVGKRWADGACVLRVAGVYFPFGEGKTEDAALADLEGNIAVFADYVRARIAKGDAPVGDNAREWTVLDALFRIGEEPWPPGDP